MDEIFKDLEILGISDVGDIKLFSEAESNEEAEKILKESINSQIVYQRKIRCTLCGKEFLTSSVRAGRIRFSDTDLDFRPLYDGFDPILYDVVVCPFCGYAALNKFFTRLSDLKAKQIKQKISPTYVSKNYPVILDYEMAIERFKLTLLNSAIGHDSNGIKAYICLKLAWLYRGYYEQRVRRFNASKNSEEEILVFEEFNKGLIEKEKVFLRNACDGFKLAFEVEEFPIMGIDQGSMEYLIAELSRRVGDFGECKKWLSRVIQRQNSNKRLFNKIVEVKRRMTEGITE